MSDPQEELKQRLMARLGWGNFPWPPEEDPKYVCSCGNNCAFIGKEEVVETNLLDNQGYVNRAWDRETKRVHMKVYCVLCWKLVRPIKE